MAVHFVRGLQSSDPEYVKVSNPLCSLQGHDSLLLHATKSCDADQLNVSKASLLLLKNTPYHLTCQGVAPTI